MKLWIDDVRPAPDGWRWVKSVDEAKDIITTALTWNVKIELISLDHDAGDYVAKGGDYIKLLDWLEEYMICCFPIHLHSANPVGVANMRRIIERNGWEEVK